MQKYQIQRKSEIREQFGISNTTHHKQINDGLMMPLINLGQRAVGGFEHESNLLLAARAAGKTNNEIRALVKQLVAARKQAMEGWCE